MQKSKQVQYDRVFFTIKVLALFFCSYPLFELFFQYSPLDAYTKINTGSLLTSLALILLVLCIWLLLTSSKSKNRVFLFLEVLVFYLICLVSIIVSGTYKSSYKFLFIFIEVAYTIQLGMKTGLVISLCSALTLIGFDLFLYDQPGVNPFFQSDMALSVMSVMIAYILGIYSQLERTHIAELTEYANVDGLTGLYNHRYFYGELHKAFEHSKENNESLCVVMMDIDYFKRYNDLYGHQKGDVVLKTLSAILKQNVRDKDLVCRYGGEEFAAILPNTSLDEGGELADKLRTAVYMEPIEGEQYLPDGKLTISLGLSQSQAGDSLAEDVVKRADTALYRAKYVRKNRVEIYRDVFEQFKEIDNTTRDALISVKTLISVINSRDSYTYNHTERVVYYCQLFAKYIDLPEDQKRTLIVAAYLHDLGKINVPKDLLITDKHLNDADWQLIKRHPVDSAEIIRGIHGLDEAATVAEQHHERYNGEGYPFGLKGENIHYLARILALADSYDAMTNERPYQKTRRPVDAVDEIKHCAGTQFDPVLSEQFIEAIKDTGNVLDSPTYPAQQDEQEPIQH